MQVPTTVRTYLHLIVSYVGAVTPTPTRRRLRLRDSYRESESAQHSTPSRSAVSGPKLAYKE
ncbi:hypothetical protein J6590_089328 [Homalodisca vitripennis]|nr:hypothetical protein J6590_089328 [Homalodisca vitripennis]